MELYDLEKVVRGILVVLELKAEDAVFAYEKDASEKAVEAAKNPKHREYAQYEKLKEILPSHLEKIKEAIRVKFSG